MWKIWNSLKPEQRDDVLFFGMVGSGISLIVVLACLLKLCGFDVK